MFDLSPQIGAMINFTTQLNRVAPTVHINGTSKDALVALLRSTISTLDCAAAMMAASAPHARDYYVQDNGALKIALDEHFNRMERVNALIAEYTDILQNVDLQEKAMGA